MINPLRSLVAAICVFLSPGCSGADNNSNEYEIEGYSSLLGLTESAVARRYGRSRVIGAQIPRHDHFETGLKILIDDAHVLLRMKDATITSVIFPSPGFRTSRGVSIGQSYCSVSLMYPEAVLLVGYADGGFLRLVHKERNIVFDFSTVGLPFDQYILEGKPARDDSTLCGAKLTEISLNWFMSDGRDSLDASGSHD